eukprot:CAMPEP_0201096474 /NCGR_PEP_ID=MMETSP0812-20130820/5446_1 /ASSEMBLY_ACC=CAM_ASM_000668 /TAXON_ID=98059 /ORGANISM="Dinobryon sp., Strain UTEXLB2267" /LENGTH=199 /DNA_ID=CAMNT_0047350765 /DNA_START=119 /DNA_END=718 /DNA_ORIENTATION=-
MLRDNLAVLEKREEHIQRKMEAALKEAKEKGMKKDKNGALLALKRKKMFEAEVNKLQGARITMDSQILALESASVNIETFRAMKAGANAMKGIRGDIDSDKVDDMMEEIQEEREVHDAISEAISRPGQDLFNDEDLLNELAELDALELEEKMLSTPASIPQTVFSLPSVPTSAVQQQQIGEEESEESRSARELQAFMMG